MLEISSPKTCSSFCDGVSRRRFIQVGALGVFGLSLADLLRAEATAGLTTRSPRSVIMIWQHGGPSQLDTFDMKPLAASEYRGPYRSIATTLPGLDISELMTEHAKVMDRSTVIRSYSHNNGDHWAAAHWMLTGRLGANGSDRVPRYPSMGAVASHLLGPRRAGVPAPPGLHRNPRRRDFFVAFGSVPKQLTQSAHQQHKRRSSNRLARIRDVT